MKNQRILSIPGTQRQDKCPTTVKSGDAVLLGGIPAFAINDYEAIYGGTTFETTGAYATTVFGRDVESPVSGEAINAGDAVYAGGGTLDAATNVTTGLTLDANDNNTYFGRLDPQYPNAPVASLATDTGAWVRIGQG